ncbi:hypothetical protein GCM10023187_13940 [Nibrella viscosa]|uniref:Uncharacterized protein n=1 Tax=Nibrella viscosa TaxID=1084524 RepID=A0ABP8K5Q7_9BACT
MLRSADEIRHSETAMWVRVLRVKPTTVKAVHADGRTQWLRPTDVWGYRTNTGSVYRLFGRMSYQLVQADDVQLYLDRVPDGRLVRDHYYFSLTPDGDLWYLNRKNIRLVFRNNPCLLHRMRKVRVGPLLQTDEQGAYELINAWRECRGEPLTSQEKYQPD